MLVTSMPLKFKQSLMVSNNELWNICILSEIVRDLKYKRRQ